MDDRKEMAGGVSRAIGDRPDEEVAKTLEEFPDDQHSDPDQPPSPAAPHAAAAQWRVAKCLVQLRDQINERFPGRKKDSDGTIGDINHCPGSSDHCPNIVEGTVGVVTAMDITHDPAHGLDAGDLAEKLRLTEDPRIQYIISNGRIANFQALGGKPPFAWRPYTGSNPHTKHFHISVRGVKNGESGYDTTSAWVL